jgi:hypothetical protein
VCAGRLWVVKRIELRTPLSRALAPVLAGLAFFAVLGVVLWGFAILIADDSESVTNLAPDQFEVGPAIALADTVAEDGPILFPGLGPDSSDRVVVLDHRGGDPLSGWRVYLAHPADRDASCLVEQVPRTSTFTDCEGRTLDVSELAPPVGISPVIPDRRTLWIDLRVANAAATTAPATSAPATTDG